jgi:hypothetical protein
MQETHVRGLYLPRLVLARHGKFGKINREKRAVYQAIDQVVDELAEHQDSGFGMSKQSIQAREDVVRARRPDVEVLPYLGEAGERVPWEMRVALDATSGKVAIRDAQDAADVNEHCAASLKFPAAPLQSLKM